MMNPSYDSTIDMDTVTVSPKFQVVIPRAIREALHLEPGEKLRVIRYADRVEFIPVRPAQKMRGFLRGMDTTLEPETSPRRQHHLRDGDPTWSHALDSGWTLPRPAAGATGPEVGPLSSAGAAWSPTGAGGRQP